MPDSACEAGQSPSKPWHVPAAVQGAAAALIAGVTCSSLHFFYSHGFSNLYGDGLAHMEGARRIFDSLTPGYEEIGSVWLPLYHLVCAPLARNDFLWRTGLAGSIVSSLAFAAMSFFLFRLGAEMNRNTVAGVVALAGALMCPNLLYLASTPLTEPMALLWAVLTVYLLFRYAQSGSWATLLGAAAVAFLGTLTRYEAWNVLPFAAVLVFFLRREPWRKRVARAALFALVAGAGPLLWILHNAYRFGNPVEFYNGAFSAKAIYAHQLATTAFPYPTDGKLWLSARYYVEDLRFVLGGWGLEFAVLGVVAWCVGFRQMRGCTVALLFILPLPFYFEAMAYAAVPLYVPTLFPHAYYNLRYGLEMIPAVALFPSFVLSPRLGKGLQVVLLAIFLALFGREFCASMSGGPEGLAVLKEGILNTPCRSKRQQAMIEFLRAHYDGKRVLVASGKWPCVMPQLGIYLGNTISDANRSYWRRMRREPDQWVEWIIQGNGDAVDNLMRAYPEAFARFEIAAQGNFPGEGEYKIYRRQE